MGGNEVKIWQAVDLCERIKPLLRINSDVCVLLNINKKSNLCRVYAIEKE